MQWSKYQEACFAGEAAGDHSMRVDAVAGSGKTTTLVEMLNRSKTPRILALAFNKKIQLELEKRLPSHIKALTLNGFGHRAIMKATPRKVLLDSDKIFNIAKEVCKGESELKPYMDLARSARTMGLVPKQIQAQGAITLVEDSRESWQEIADYYDLDFSMEIYEKAYEILLRSIFQARTGLIDFDDQIYMPALFGYPLDKYDLVVGDETQDWSLLNHKIIARSVAPGGRVIAFGDPRQAIYGFRGAHAKSMDLLGESFNMKDYPLSVSYRCPINIVKEAQRIVPHIEWSPSAPKGEVRILDSWSISDLPSVCTILCRNNAPLFELAFQLIRKRRRVTMLGRDIGAGLEKVLDKLDPNRHNGGTPIEIFLSRLQQWAEAEIKAKPKREGIINDKVESLRALSEGCSNTMELRLLISQIFSDQTAPITLSSIHRAKGLEWEEVFILDRWRIPSKYAVQDWQKEQENNLLYVAITRSKNRLTYINLDQMKD